MTTATCKCSNGHLFHSKVVEDSPDINYFEVDEPLCPECGSEDFTVEEVNYDDPNEE